MEQTSKPSEVQADKIRIQFRDHLAELNSYWSEQYKESNDNLSFSSGYQWDKETEAERSEDDRPSLVKNFTRTMINNVVNPLRVHPMGIKVNSEDKDFTELVSDIFRNIEYKSRAKESYDIAYENAVTGGFGWVKIGLDYDDDEGLDQKLTVDPIRNPLSVYIDPYSDMIDGSDANYGVHVDYMDRNLAKDQHGDDIEDGGMDGIDVYENWSIPDGSVADIMYYVVETKKTPRYWYKGAPTFTDQLLEGEEIIRQRTVEKKQVKCYRFVGHKLVEESTVPIPFIPLIPFYADRLHVGEERNIPWAGIPHWVKDSQKMVNFYASNEAELAALAPKAPYIAEESQIGDYADIWATANTKNHSYLPYKATSIDGTPIAAPQRANNQAQTGGLIESRNQAQADMGRSAGIFDNQLGDKQTSNESGLAVLTRKLQGELNTAQYSTNFEQSLAQVARVVLHLIPYAYDTPRQITMRDAQGQTQTITAKLSDVITPQVLKQLEVTTEAGPQHADKKAAAVDSMLAFARVDPSSMPLMRDEIAKNSDLPGMDVLAERFAKMLPSSLQEGFNPEEALQQSQQIQAENDELKAVVLQLQTKILDNEKDRTADIVEEEIKAEAKLAAVRIQESSKDDREAAKIEATARENFLKAKAELAKAEAANAPSLTVDFSKDL